MKDKSRTPARSNVIVLKQLLNHIPLGTLNRLARQTGVEEKARSFSARSHVAAMLFAQLAHAISLNDVCDWLRLKAAALGRFGVTPPARNTLSHANRQRGAAFAEQLFWSTLGHLQQIRPAFATGRRGRGLLRRFKVRIHAVDSTTMQLVANCMDWARHRRRKAAAMGNVPAYIIYTDKTLKEIALARPRTLEELLNIRGIGPAKARQFGEETLAIVR